MKYVVVALALTAASCAHTPPNLTPTGAATFRANEAVVALGTVQHAAIELNKIQVCQQNAQPVVPPLTSPAPCHPFLSDANTGVVVDNATTAFNAVKAIPDGWKAAITQALSTISERLDADGRASLGAYLTAASTILNSL